MEPDQFELDSISLEKKLQERFPADFLSLIKKIANEVASVGLTEKEACMICDLDYARFTALKQNEPLIRQLFERKNLEYKRILLKPLSDKAKTDDKLAQWLLESRFPDDFNKKKRNNPDDGMDVMGEIITVIQKESGIPNSPSLIKETSGTAFRIRKQSADDSAPPLSAQDILKSHGTLIEKLKERDLIPTTTQE